MSAQALAEKASQHSIKITPITSSTDSKKPEFLLSFAGIAKEDIAPGIEALKKPLKTVKKSLAHETASQIFNCLQ